MAVEMLWHEYIRARLSQVESCLLARVLTRRTARVMAVVAFLLLAVLLRRFLTTRRSAGATGS